MNTQSLIARINACTSTQELDLLKDEAWNADHATWSAFVDRGIEINQARSAAVAASMELARFGETGREQCQRLARRLAGTMALADMQAAGELAQRQHDEAAGRAMEESRRQSEIFQQQCDLNNQIHMAHHF